ncbi:hypothetical protein [Amylolactobacillus amylophilus]|uniref:hypothetical protein n=1 Tax=Amylolactobacillus amylophilus TaxID=1603 RepID=UPI000AB16D16|nr:hypothetical protein [Amylolactobacillus amylophilus]
MPNKIRNKADRIITQFKPTQNQTRGRLRRSGRQNQLLILELQLSGLTFLQTLTNKI